MTELKELRLHGMASAWEELEWTPLLAHQADSSRNRS
jgi:hypothetical protein